MTSPYQTKPVASWVGKDQPVAAIYKESRVYHL